MERDTGETAWRHAKFIGQRYDRYVSPYAMAGRAAWPMIAGGKRWRLSVGAAACSFLRRVSHTRPPTRLDSCLDNTQPRARPVPPEGAEPRAVPPQRCLGLDARQGLPPGADAPGEQHQERPIRPRHGGARDAAPLHEQVLTQEGVLGEQLRPAAQQVRPRPCRVCHHRRSRPEARAEGVPHTGDECGRPTTAPAKQHQAFAPPQSHRPGVDVRCPSPALFSALVMAGRQQRHRPPGTPGWIMSQHTGCVRGERRVT